MRHSVFAGAEVDGNDVDPVCMQDCEYLCPTLRMDTLQIQVTQLHAQSKLFQCRSLEVSTCPPLPIVSPATHTTAG